MLKRERQTENRKTENVLTEAPLNVIPMEYWVEQAKNIWNNPQRRKK